MPRSHKNLARHNKTSAPVWDPDSERYVSRLVAAGKNVTYLQRTALNTWYRSGKAKGWFSKVTSMTLHTWAAAGPNAVNLITSAPVGFFSGTVTHNTGKISFGANGYFNFNAAPAALGLSATNQTLFMMHANNETGTADVMDMGTYEQGFECNPAWSLPPKRGYFRMGGFSNNVLSFEGVDTTGITVGGIWAQSRDGANAVVKFHNGTSVLTMASSSSFSGGAIPSVNITLGCRMDTPATPAGFTQREYRLSGAGTGLTSTQVDDFLTDTKSLLTGLSVSF